MNALNASLILSLTLVVACSDTGGVVTSAKPVPTPPVPDTNGETTPPPTGSVSGRVTNTLNGQTLSGIKVEVPDMTFAVTGPNGEFSLSALRGGERHRVVVGASGYIQRETHITLTFRALAEVDILPEDSKFSLAFFDHV